MEMLVPSEKGIFVFSVCLRILLDSILSSSSPCLSLLQIDDHRPLCLYVEGVSWFSVSRFPVRVPILVCCSVTYLWVRVVGRRRLCTANCPRAVRSG